MSALSALAWRLMYTMLYAQRALLLWLRMRVWNWKLWRAAASLLVPGNIKERARGKRERREDCRYLQSAQGECGYLTQPCDCKYLKHRCDCKYLQQLQCDIKYYRQHGDCQCQQQAKSWRRDGAGLAKLPQHVGLLISEESHSYADVANLVVWCMAVGISYISVYDNHGIFKQNSSRLMEEVLKQQREFFGYEFSNQPLECGNGSTDKTEKVLGRLPLLKVLSPEDGKGQIVKAAQNFCHLVAQQQKRPTDMDVDVLDHLIRSTQGFPDPDLILKFGSIDSMLGFLPWHIRLSEIISIHSHVNISYEDFFSALCCYANCEQRLGK
ncbi:dehydrodolichyl diphosphate synthase complex subunit NUS1 [Discoglossus pictus]